MMFTNPVVGGTTLVRPAIQSPNYSSGVSGWTINADGSAEFNNLTVRGTFRTANPPNQRIEIGTTTANRMDFYSGNAAESCASYIQSTYASLRSFLELVSGCTNSNSRSYVELNSGPTGGGLANFTIGFAQNNVALNSDGDFHCFLGATGIGRFYCSAERLLIDNFGIAVTGTIDSTAAINSGGNLTCVNDLFVGQDTWMNYQEFLGLRGYGDFNHGLTCPPIGSWRQSAWNQDGPVLCGYIHVMLATAADNHWQLICAQNAAVGVYGKFAVGGASTNDVNWDFEDITTYGGASGISMRQRNRSWNDLTKRIVFYPENDSLHIWQDTASIIFSIGVAASGLNSFSSAYIAVPALGGGNTMNLQVNGSWQIGYISSSGKHKENVRDLDSTADQNPIWKLKPRRFKWNETLVGNGKEINDRHPNGIAGLIAEEVAAFAPDAVTYAGNLHAHCPEGCTEQHPKLEGIEEGDPVGLDNDRLIAYLIDAVQHLKKEVGKWQRN